MKLLILAQDLMMISSVRKFAEDQAWKFETFGSVEKLNQATSNEAFDILLIDLQLPGLDLAEINSLAENHKQASPAGSATPKSPILIGYGQHVYAELLSQGRKQGLDRVVTRGQMISGIAEILNLASDP
jgi:CheY-like chemotaxis protein